MITSTRDGRHYAWAGVEFGRLRRPPTAARLDPDGMAGAAAGRLLDLVDAADVASTIELRFRRDDRAAGLGAALLVRVDGTDRDRVERHLALIVDEASTYELADTSVLAAERLLWWLGRHLEPPRWASVVRRRVLHTPEPMPREPFWSSVVASAPCWHMVVDELVGLPSDTSVGVRLRRAVVGPSDVGELDRILLSLDRWTRPAWDSQAGVLGVAIERAASPFAVEARSALEPIRNRFTGHRYWFDIGVSGPGSAGSIRQWVASLVPSPEHHGGALELVDVSREQLAGFRRADQSLDRPPAIARVNLIGTATRAAESLDAVEAASLIHLPRAGPIPTPGFALSTEPATGIPAAPFVFLSYNRVDVELAHQFASLFAEWRVPLWWDARIVGGTEWEVELGRALADERCRAVVVLLTERTALSDWVRRETLLARERGLPVVQVRCRAADPLDDRWQIVDLSGWTGSRADGRTALLERDVRARLARTA
jgi:hypothetical protein